jgi:hypothetical protein
MGLYDIDPDKLCPGTGENGHLDFRAAGDDWWVVCHVCGTTWAGGSQVLEPHEDRRPHPVSTAASSEDGTATQVPEVAMPEQTGTQEPPGETPVNSWVEESGFEVDPKIVKELYTSTFDDALELVRSAQALGLGFQFRNYWERDNGSTSDFTQGFGVTVYEDAPLDIDDEDEEASTPH